MSDRSFEERDVPAQPSSINRSAFAVGQEEIDTIRGHQQLAPIWAKLPKGTVVWPVRVCLSYAAPSKSEEYEQEAFGQIAALVSS